MGTDMGTDMDHLDDDRTAESRGRREAVSRYVVSLPERMVRAAAALIGGAVYETSAVALPG